MTVLMWGDYIPEKEELWRSPLVAPLPIEQLLDNMKKKKKKKKKDFFLASFSGVALFLSGVE